MAILTDRGCFALTFPYFTLERWPKICCLVGGRGLFLLVPAGFDRDTGKPQYNLGCGDCYIDGFKDGKGVEICKSLGLKEEDIVLV